MGILKPIKKNEFQTLTVKVSQSLYERLRTIQKKANDAGLEFDNNEILVGALEKAVSQAEKELGKLGKAENQGKQKAEVSNEPVEPKSALMSGNGAETANSKVV